MTNEPIEAGSDVTDLPTDPVLRTDLTALCLRLGDDRLVLGQRLAAWCGHAPILEDDLALSNVALDLLGQAAACLALAARLEGAGRDADDLAFRRDLRGFRNLLLVEQPNGDFAATIVRQYLFDAAATSFLPLLTAAPFAPLARFAAKAAREADYHLRFSRAWLLRLGDGTEESRRRAQAALDDLWAYTGELFEDDELYRRLHAAGIVADLALGRMGFMRGVEADLAEATLQRPERASVQHSGGRRGLHTEHLGHLLDEMQVLPRSYPDARW